MLVFVVARPRRLADTGAMVVRCSRTGRSMDVVHVKRTIMRRGRVAWIAVATCVLQSRSSRGSSCARLRILSAGGGRSTKGKAGNHDADDTGAENQGQTLELGES